MEILRTALQRTLEDPEFLKDAKKLNLDLGFIPGSEVEKHAEEALTIPDGARAKLKSLIGSKN